MLNSAFKQSLRWVIQRKLISFVVFWTKYIILTPLLNLLLLTWFSVGQRRFQSTSTTFLTKRSQETLRKNWLSDPSTYPLIAIMGGAAALVLGVGSSCIMYNPDVQINPNKRGNVMREWKFWTVWHCWDSMFWPTVNSCWRTESIEIFWN